ncbi:MAG: ribosome-binding factor A [Myxococcales bacterium]|nr:ribosome-binding factor A [Myxococcales bacterium]
MSHRKFKRGQRDAGAPSVFVDPIEEEDSHQRSSAGHRGARLERTLERELRAMVSDDLRDPLARRALVLRVELSVDYRNARVYFTHEKSSAPWARDAARSVTSALERCAPFLRVGLAEALAMDRVPLLRFVYESDPPASWLDEQPHGESCE